MTLIYCAGCKYDPEPHNCNTFPCKHPDAKDSWFHQQGDVRKSCYKKENHVIKSEFMLTNEKLNGNCPYCNGDNLDLYDQWEENIGTMFHREMKCSDCGKTFSFIYKLIGWHEDVY